MNDLNIIRYVGAMAMAGKLLDKGLIGRREFLSFEEGLRVKYGLDKNSIYRDYRLISPGSKR